MEPRKLSDNEIYNLAMRVNDWGSMGGSDNPSNVIGVIDLDKGIYANMGIKYTKNKQFPKLSFTCPPSHKNTNSYK